MLDKENDFIFIVPQENDYPSDIPQDYAPILTPYKEPKIDPPETEDEFTIPDWIKELQEKEKKQTEKKPEIDPIQLDPFEQAINRLKRQVGPAIKEAIESTPCFARGWKIESNVCPGTDCDLKSMCQQTYQKISKSTNLPKRVLLPSKLSPPKPSKHPKKAKVEPILTQKEIDRIGGAVEQLAEIFWLNMGQPPARTQSLARGNPNNRTPADRIIQQKTAIQTFGSGTFRTIRRKYHVYYHNGIPLVRFWIDANSYTSIELASQLVGPLQDAGFKTRNTVPKCKAKHYLYYTHRVSIYNNTDAAKAGAVIYKSLHLFPLPEGMSL